MSLSHRLLPALLLGLAGCWVTGSEIDEKLGERPDIEESDSENPTDTEQSDTEDPTLEDLEVQSVEPAHGSTAGGTQVVITVDTDLDDSVVVTFGGEEATVVDVDGDEVVVSTPDASSAGQVAVKVVTDTHTGRQTQAFRYWEDGEGQYGIIGEISWYEVMGDYWKDASNYSMAWIALAEPHTSPEHADLYGGSTDNCTTSPSYGLPTLYSPDVDEVELVAGAGSSTLTGSGGLFETEDDLDYSSHPDGETFELNIDEADDYPQLSLDVARMPSLPGISYPVIDGSTADILYEDATFYWDDTDPGDYIVLELIAVYDDFASTDEVYCVLEDDGFASLATSSLWTDYTGADYVLIYMGRVELGGDEALHDGATSGVAAISWEVGAAYPFAL